MYHLILIIQCVSVAALFAECCVVFNHWKSRLHAYLFLSCASTLVNSVGYLLELTARSEEAYIAALRVSYLGRVWAPFALLLFSTELVRLRVPRFVKAFLALFSTATYLAVLTTGFTGLYYHTETSFSVVDSFPVFTHTNGIWHHSYAVVLALYTVSTIFVLIAAVRREKDPVAKKQQWMTLLAIVVQGACVIAQMVKLLPVCRVYDISMLSFPVAALFMFIAIFRYDLLDMAILARQFVVEQLSEAIIAVDAQGVVKFSNRPAQDLFPELRAQPQDVVSALRGAIDRNEPLRLGERVYTPEANSLRQDDAVIGTLYALTDDTEHYRYMDELREQKRLADAANKAKSTFLANMSHEIRTPINAILGMDEMILRESGEEEILDYAEDIESAGRTLLSIINDILDLSKIEEGKMEILPARYDLSSLVNDLVNMTRPRADNKGLRFVVRVDENIPRLLLGDEIRIRQCALNILTNAVKYTEKGTVTMTLGFEKRGEDRIALRFSVADTGIGMKQEDMDRLFAPFERIEESRNRSVEGTGLGMSITKQLLALMDSKLDVESVYGEGSTFSFAVEQPVESWEPVGRFVGRRAADAPHRVYRELFHAPEARILVVDDTPVNLTVIRGLLKRTQIKVDTASSGAEALLKAENTAYDVIFIDHMMPDMDGVETLRRLRALPNTATVPCVALTANAISGAREAYLAAGFTDYVSKPVDGAKLEKLLLGCLPPDKVRAVTPENAAPAPVLTPVSASDGAEDAALPDWLRAVDELDVAQGLSRCGTAETYLDTLAVYAKNAASAADEIEKLWRAGDAGGVTVKVHALKSTSRAIGAEELGALAEKLEAAGKAGDTRTLEAELGGLLARFRALGTALAPLCETDAPRDDSGLPPLPEGKLREAYDSLREFAANMDSDGAAYVLDYLAGFRIPEGERERVRRARQAVENYDWDKIEGILS